MSPVQTGLLPGSRGVVVLCGSQAAGWDASGSVRSLGPWFTGGTWTILRDVVGVLVLGGQRNGRNQKTGLIRLRTKKAA